MGPCSRKALPSLICPIEVCSLAAPWLVAGDAFMLEFLQLLAG